MARKKKDSAPEAEAAPARTVQLISDKHLKALLRGDDSYKEQISGLTGELREKIGEAVENKHLHKGAYAMLKKLHRMTDEKLADFWDHFQVYFDMRVSKGNKSLAERIAAVQKLPLEDPDETTANEGADEEDADNVTRLPRAAAAGATAQ